MASTTARRTVPHQKAYESAKDFCTPCDYLDYMYSDRQGYLFRATINGGYRQAPCKTKDVQHLPFWGVPNTYLSVNSFFSRKDRHGAYVPKRNREQLKRINALYVDIDCYNVGLSKDIVLSRLRREHFGRTMPIPTFIIDSGRGLYLIWKFIRTEDRNAYPRWKRVSDHLISLTRELGADPQCSEPTRVLRVPGTVNSKSNTYVKVIDFCTARYTLKSIAQECGIRTGCVTPKMRKYALDIAKSKNIDPPDLRNFSATGKFISENRAPKGRDRSSNVIPFIRKTASFQEAIYAGRCKDIENLLTSRAGENTRRELGLFIYRMYIYKLTGDYEYALNAMLALNARLSAPLPAKRLQSDTESAIKIQQRGKFYSYSLKRLVTDLAITDDEQESMRYLRLAKGTPQERKKAANQRYYERRIAATGKCLKNSEMKRRRADVAEYLRDGRSAIEIAGILQLSVRTVQRDIKAISAHSIEEIPAVIQGCHSEKKDAKNGNLSFDLGSCGRTESNKSYATENKILILKDLIEVCGPSLPVSASGRVIPFPYAVIQDVMEDFDDDPWCTGVDPP